MATILGRNVAVKQENGKLLIEINLQAKGEPSKSGETLVIATTKGNQPIAHGNKVLKLGLNLFTAPEA